MLIFRVRSARKMAITDSVLLRRLSAIVLLYSSYLTVWMVIQPPVVESSVTADKLKYERCTKGWFGYMILAGKNLFTHSTINYAPVRGHPREAENVSATVAGR